MALRRDAHIQGSRWGPAGPPLFQQAPGILERAITISDAPSPQPASPHTSPLTLATKLSSNRSQTVPSRLVRLGQLSRTNVTSIVTRYSEIFPLLTLALCSTTCRPVMPRSVLFARASPSRTA
jgi:hypothetical protein